MSAEKPDMSAEKPTEYWGDAKVSFIEKDKVNIDLPIVAVKCYLMKDNSILLVKDETRGWDVPGGHVEKGEDAEAAAKRELTEEANCAVNQIELMGYLHCLQTKPQTKYPNESLVAVYGSHDFSIHKSEKLVYETFEAKLVPFEEVSRYHHNWTPLKEHIVSMLSNLKQ
jgi:ADP-ribose pyrophosphatase YjhB (NUDIX family)